MKNKSDLFLVDKDHAKKICRITLNRPEKLNCFSSYEMADLAHLLKEIEHDDDINVLILKGAGRAFSTGHDVSEIGRAAGIGDGKAGERRASQRSRLFIDRNHYFGATGLFMTLLHLNKATIAQIHGYAYGGGLLLALCSDICIAAEGTMMTNTGWRYVGPAIDGLFPLWVATIGLHRTKEMMLTGRPFTAAEAERWGLINRVVPLDKLDEEVNRTAEAVAMLPRDGIAMSKAYFEGSLEQMGISASNTMSYVMHSLVTNIRFEPDEWNMLKVRRDKGVKEAIREREERYSHLGMAHPGTKE